MDQQDPELQLIRYIELPAFPSASAIEYNDGKLFILGDDATYMLVLDTNYQLADSVRYNTDTSYRLSKAIKADIECVTIVSHNNKAFLYALGSFSTAQRRNLFFFPLAHKDSFLSIDYSRFAEKLKGIPELNIEGLAFAKSKFILSNRANKTHTINKLIITGNELSNLKNMQDPFIMDILLEPEKIIGVSGLCYFEEKDILFFTASEEDTPNALQDGTISDSYLGWIEDFSGKMEQKTIKPDHMIKLPTVDKVFIKQKIESVCVEKTEGKEMILHLVADNDNGSSSLFKIRVKI